MTNAGLFLLAEGTTWLDRAASTSAERYEAVFRTVLYVTGFFFVLVMVLMLTFVIRYRRRQGAHPEEAPTHNTPLEIIWTVIPLGVVTTFFVLGFRAFLEEDIPPAGAAVIDVEARQWSFTFTHPNGAPSNRLYLRVNQPVVLRLTSRDVLHSLYIPAFRVQRNAVPGRTVDLAVHPTRVGTYPVLCTQYCGNRHTLMTTDAVVLEDADYAAEVGKLANIFVDPVTNRRLSYAEVGKLLYERQLNCSQCHSVDDSPGTGPTWLGLYKRDHEFFEAPPGYTLKAGDSDAKWDAYLRESILDPQAKVVLGFPKGGMQSYADQFSGSPDKERRLTAIVEYIKSLDNHAPGGKPKYYHPLPPPDFGAKPGEPPAAKKPSAEDKPQKQEKQK